MTFTDLIGATIVAADAAGVRVRLADGREAEVFPDTEDYPSLANVPTLCVY